MGLLPSHLGVFKRGAHFAHMRHFPFAYVLAGLEAFVAANASLPDAPNMKTPDFVEAIAKRGVSYDPAHAQDMSRLAESNALLSNFHAADFAYAITDGKVIDKVTCNVITLAPPVKDIDGEDKLAMQGYGRPYK